MTLIYGDSQVKYLQHSLGNSNIVVTSISGLRVEEVFAKISDILPLYNTLVLHVGTNNIPHDTPANIQQYYEHLINSILQTQPNLRLIVSGIVPRHTTQFRGVYQDPIGPMNRKAAATNLRLRQVCRNRSLKYISVWCAFLDRDFLSRDGLHLSPSGIAYLSNECIRAITG
jgi:lysophospholipase L1-like esterase